MAYKISQIFLNSGTKGSSAGEIFISQPDEYKESLAGKLFVLLEIESSKSRALKIANFLVNNINYNYYQNEKIMLREKVNSITVEHIFETTLTNVNKDLIDFLNQEKIKVSPYSINITAGVVYGSELYFSTVGKNKNLLIFTQGKTGEGKIKYGLNDIGDSKRKQTQATNLFKLFSDVISGELPENGYYFLINETLREYLSDKQIIDIITKLPPASAATHIENLLGQINVNALFLGLVLKNTAGKSEAIEPEEESPENQVWDLNQTRKETEDILKPAGIINLGKIKSWAGQGYKKIKQIRKAPQGKKYSPSHSQSPAPENQIESTPDSSPSQTPIQLKEKLFFQKKERTISGGKIISGLKTGIWGIISLLVYTIRFFSDFNNIKNLISRSRNLPHYLKRKLAKSIRFLTGLSLKRKITLVVVIFFVVAFASSTSFYIKQNQKREALAALNELVAEIEKNQNKIEANLLYDNNKNARELMAENEEKLANLNEKISPEYADKEEKFQELEKIHEDQEAEIMNLVDLAGNLETVKNLTAANSQARAQNLSFREGSLYLADSENNNVYKINLEDNLILTLSGKNLPQLNYPSFAGDSLYFFDSEQMTALSLETEDFRTLDYNLPEGGQINDMNAFGGSLYLLDSQNNQIYKYNQTSNLTIWQNWLPQGANLEGGEKLAIDGYIYTLSSEGKVNKYLTGEKEDFSLDNIYPEIKNPSKIKVTPEIDQGLIYILEPEQKRLLVFDKQGKFQKQYQSETFTDLKDFYVDEENQIIYFLDGQSVFKYQME